MSKSQDRPEAFAMRTETSHTHELQPHTLCARHVKPKAAAQHLIHSVSPSETNPCPLLPSRHTLSQVPQKRMASTCPPCRIWGDVSVIAAAQDPPQPGELDLEIGTAVLKVALSPKWRFIPGAACSCLAEGRAGRASPHVQFKSPSSVSVCQSVSVYVCVCVSPPKFQGHLEGNRSKAGGMAPHSSAMPMKLQE